MKGKKYLFKKKFPTTVQIYRLENIKHKNMKQVFYSGKYSLSASRAHQSHLQCDAYFRQRSALNGIFFLPFL